MIFFSKRLQYLFYQKFHMVTELLQKLAAKEEFSMKDVKEALLVIAQEFRTFRNPLAQVENIKRQISQAKILIDAKKGEQNSIVNQKYFIFNQLQPQIKTLIEETSIGKDKEKQIIEMVERTQNKFSILAADIEKKFEKFYRILQDKQKPALKQQQIPMKIQQYPSQYPNQIQKLNPYNYPQQYQQQNNPYFQPQTYIAQSSKFISTTASQFVDPDCVCYKFLEILDSTIIAKDSAIVFGRISLSGGYGWEWSYTVTLSSFSQYVILGIADTQYKYKKSLTDQAHRICYWSDRDCRIGRQKKQRQGQGLKMGQTVNVVINTNFGYIDWKVGNQKRHRVNCEMLKDRSIGFVPFIFLPSKNDRITIKGVTMEGRYS